MAADLVAWIGCDGDADRFAHHDATMKAAMMMVMIVMLVTCDGACIALAVMVTVIYWIDRV